MGLLAWVVGGAVFMVFEAWALHTEMADFPGGPQALAQTVLPSAEAIRPLRWPAERLDTLGGYLTYHNILLFQGFLALYAAVQGAKAVRQPEERHWLEQVLATGWSRTAVLRDRVLGFVVTLLLMTIGLAGGVGVSLAMVGEADWAGSAISIAAVGLCALVGYALGVLVSQFTRTGRSATGWTVLVLVGLYLLTNEWENLGPLGVVRFVSPFYYANFSRALVPGYGLDLPSMAVMVAMALVLLAGAAFAFARRDYGRGLWSRTRAEPEQGLVRPHRWWLRTIWLTELANHRLGLLAWTASTIGLGVLFMAVQPAVVDAWSLFDFMTAMFGTAGGTPEALYTSFASDLVAPIVVAYAVSGASGWVADLEQGRVEQVLAAPVTWSRLVGERLVATMVGVAILTIGWFASIVVVSAVLGAPVEAAGIGRSVTMCLLVGWASAALAALVVSVTRSAIASTLLTVYVVAAYLLTWFVGVFGWPAWVSRLSVFDSFGHPYQAWPDTTALVVLLLVGLVGSAAAAGIAERTPKVA